MTVVSSSPRDKHFNSEKGKLLDFGSAKYGQVWGVEMLTGRDAGQVCNFPSLLLQGQGGGSENVSLRRSEGPPA